MNNKNNRNDFASQTDELLKTYRKRLAKEGWIKSLLCGLTVGFCLDIICSVVFLFFGIKLFWVGIIAFALGTAATTPLFYYRKFKKSTRQVAARVDTLGLEERILTMAQLEGDDSFMARRQREDAIGALKKVNDSLLRLAVSIPMIAICAATCVLGAGATTATALADKGIIDAIVEKKTEEETPAFDVIYGVQNEDGGRVEGELNQKVKRGESTTPVEAVADDDYVFVGWSDGYEEPIRSDVVTDKNMEVFAIFELIGETDEDDEEKDGEEADGSGKGEDGSGQGGGDSVPKPGDPAPSDGEGGDGQGDGDGAGGSSVPSNQVIDGSTFYGDEYGNSLSDAQDSMNSNGGNMSGEQTDVIGDYFNNIAR